MGNGLSCTTQKKQGLVLSFPSGVLSTRHRLTQRMPGVGGPVNNKIRHTYTKFNSCCSFGNPSDYDWFELNLPLVGIVLFAKRKRKSVLRIQ